MIDHEYGDPVSELISLASSSARASYRFRSPRRISTRSATLIRGQGPVSKARRAAVTARSMSAGAASGVRPNTSSVTGEIISSVAVVAGST